MSTRQCEVSYRQLPTRTDHMRWRCHACGRRVLVKRGRVALHYVSGVAVR